MQVGSGMCCALCCVVLCCGSLLSLDFVRILVLVEMQ